jgi:hypothetical protein
MRRPFTELAQMSGLLLLMDQSLRRHGATACQSQPAPDLEAIAPVGRTARIAVTAPAYGVGGSLQEVAKDNKPSK